ncbi:MAG TPA: DUF4231 domain-containing protein [Chloroflexia bacterium]|nr:DUF4231 domain-containing protein [Chloroflexia bacterium]
MQLQEITHFSQNPDEIREQIYQCQLGILQNKSRLNILIYILIIALVTMVLTLFFAINANPWGYLYFLICAGAFALWGIFLYYGGYKTSVEYQKLRTQLKFLKVQLRQAEQSKYQDLEYRQQYVQRIPELITTYRRKADGYRRWYTSTQLLTIFLSALITSISGGWLDPYIRLPWLTPVLGLLVSILTGITLHFRFREKGFNLQQTADSIDLEYNAHRLGIHDYSKFDERQSLTLLAERIESLRDEQQKRQQQLEQSSQGDQNTAKPTAKAQRK